MVRAVENITAHHQLARITVELMIPIPMPGSGSKQKSGDLDVP